MTADTPGIPASTHPPVVRRSSVLVLICGLATTALSLLGVYILNVTTEDFNIMGWYANYVLPVGAVLVGIAASSGYGLASWFSGIRITRLLLWTVLALQVVAYFLAQYIEFKSLHLAHRETGKPVGFVEYFDFAARSFAWKQRDGSMGQPLGLWGYAFRGLEIVGFAAGGLIVPALLRKAPYCDPCQLYMRTAMLGWIPASVPVKKIKKSDTEALAAHEREQAEAAQRGLALLEGLRANGSTARFDEFHAALDQLKAHQKETLKLPQRIWLKLVSCKVCNAGRLEAAVVVGQGNQVQETRVGETALAPDFVQLVRQRP